jgi:hypothetical protein
MVSSGAVTWLGSLCLYQRMVVARCDVPNSAGSISSIVQCIGLLTCVGASILSILTCQIPDPIRSSFRSLQSLSPCATACRSMPSIQFVVAQTTSPEETVRTDCRCILRARISSKCSDVPYPVGLSWPQLFCVSSTCLVQFHTVFEYMGSFGIADVRQGFCVQEHSAPIDSFHVGGREVELALFVVYFIHNYFVSQSSDGDAFQSRCFDSQV